MDQQQIFMRLPGIQPDEFMLIKSLVKDLPEMKQQQFFSLYSGKRKTPLTLLMLTILGFLGIAGIQRFITGDTGMGILYLLTGGLLGIGTIVDLVNNQNMAFRYNQKQAAETAVMVKMMNS